MKIVNLICGAHEPENIRFNSAGEHVNQLILTESPLNCPETDLRYAREIPWGIPPLPALCCEKLNSPATACGHVLS